jgi:hypothetical protein
MNSIELNEQWMIELNTRFTRNHVPHSIRDVRAIEEWEKQTGRKITKTSAEFALIDKFFNEYKKIQGVTLGPIYHGVFYYDDCFWQVTIPIIFGQVMVYPDSLLNKCPSSIRYGIKSESQVYMQYLSLWADCMDFSQGYDDLTLMKHANEFWEKLLVSGRQHVDSAVSLLLEDIPNPKAIEQTRMATEMFLKSYLAKHAGKEEERIKAYGHNLEKPLKAICILHPETPLRVIQDIEETFPPISARYTGEKQSWPRLWKAYRLAQFIGATLVRTVTKRDTRCVYMENQGRKYRIPIR